MSALISRLRGAGSFPRVALVQLNGSRPGLPTAPDPEVEELDEDGEAHREVDVTLRDVLVETFEEEGEADQQEEAQGEHLHRRVAVDEAAHGLGGDQHHQDGDGDGGDHHGDLIDHADGGYDRVKREDRVEEDYLHQDAAEVRRYPRALVSLLALEVLVDLEGAFAEQEEAAEDQDQVAPGDLLAQDRKERRGEPNDPAEGQEQQDAHDQRQSETEATGERLPLLRQLINEDGDEDDVVYPQHDLQGQQRKKSHPDFGVQQQVHASYLTFLSSDTALVSEPISTTSMPASVYGRPLSRAGARRRGGHPLGREGCPGPRRRGEASNWRRSGSDRMPS